MSNNEWVQEGTPRDDAEWTEEADDYGVPVEPAEWDDYSDEQAMPVPPRPVQPESQRREPEAEETATAPEELEEPVLPLDEPADNVNQPTAPDPDDVVVGEDEPIAAVDDDPVIAPGDESAPAADEEPVLAADDDPFTAPDDEPISAPEEPSFHDEEPAGAHDATTAAAEESVFADDRPVDPADDDLTREVSEGIDAELHHEDTEAHDGGAHLVDEPLTVDAPADDVPDEDPIVGDPHADEPVADDHVVDEPLTDDDLAAQDGGATRVDPDELEETALVDQVDHDRDDEPTRVREDEAFGRPADEDLAVTAAASGTAGAALAAPGAMAGLYRTDADETQVLDTTPERRSVEDEAAEEEARAAALRAEKEERDRRLGLVQTSDANAERELRTVRRGVGPFGSFGLFVLRLITAAILGIVAYQVLYSIDTTADFLAQHPLIPEPRLVAWIVGFTMAAMAVLLVIGLAVRVVGLLLAVLAGLTLAFIRWGNFSPFVDGMEGFLGDKDLLLAAVGVLLFSLGGGRFGIDGAISRSRAEAREAKRA